ncbi:MAG: hypothetical protein O9301_14885 [Leptospira sp.]|nr:hypothetical protein [Leptospira sp.]
MKRLQIIIMKWKELCKWISGSTVMLSAEALNDTLIYRNEVKKLALNLLVAVSVYICVYFFGYLISIDEFQNYNKSVLVDNSYSQNLFQKMSLYPWNLFLLLFLYLTFFVFSIFIHYVILFLLEKIKHLWKSLFLIHLEYFRILFLFTTLLYVLNRIQSSWKIFEFYGINYIVTFCLFLSGVFFTFKHILNSSFSKSPFLIPKHRTNFVWGLVTLFFILIGYGQI